MRAGTVSVLTSVFDEIEHSTAISKILATPPNENSKETNAEQLDYLIWFINAMKQSIAMNDLDERQKSLFRTLVHLRDSRYFAEVNDWGNSVYEHSLAIIAFNIAKGEVVYRAS